MAQPDSSLYTVRMDVSYGSPDPSMKGDAYLPSKTTGPTSALVAVHGGGWQAGDKSMYKYFGPWLASRGVALFSINYRLVAGAKNNYPACLEDAKAAVWFLRSNAAQFNLDRERLGIIGDSAGGHVGGLIALAGDADEAVGQPQSTTDVSCRVKVCVGVYGVYDLIAQWNHDLSVRPLDNITEKLMGFPPMMDRMAWLKASTTSHVNFAQPGAPSFFLAWGTEDDIVDCKTQSEPFLIALKQAKYYVRTATVQAGHFWMSDPVDDEDGFPGIAKHVAGRILRFLQERL